MKSAVLLLIFNREDTTRQVFECIRQAKPPRLYVAADGPRKDKEGEKEKCMRTRAVINVDWDCKVDYLYRDDNLGCGKGVSSALSWFFEHEDEGIIIEDDIIPDISFFDYCDEMLEKYRNNYEIAVICGHNALEDYPHTDTYYKSRLFQMWGWATWKRFWETYIYDTEKINRKEYVSSLKARKFTKRECVYWKLIFDSLKRHKKDTWDYQVFFDMTINRFYSIMLYNNITRNIGISHPDATHTTNENRFEYQRKIHSAYPITCTSLQEDLEADREIARNWNLYNDIKIIRAIKRIFRLIYH